MAVRNSMLDAVLTGQRSSRLVKMDMDGGWTEGLHPRGYHGKWINGHSFRPGSGLDVRGGRILLGTVTHSPRGENDPQPFAARSGTGGTRHVGSAREAVAHIIARGGQPTAAHHAHADAVLRDPNVGWDDKSRAQGAGDSVRERIAPQLHAQEMARRAADTTKADKLPFLSSYDRARGVGSPWHPEANPDSAGWNEGAHPRGYHGKWIDGHAGSQQAQRESRAAAQRVPRGHTGGVAPDLSPGQRNYQDQLALQHGRVHVHGSSPVGGGARQMTVPGGASYHVRTDGSVARQDVDHSVNWRQ